MASEHNPVKRILIVGGGMTGWMAAAYLNRRLRGSGCSVTVVESIKLDTAAIGATTLPAMVGFLRGMRIDETAFMQQCAATYNLGTRFSNWMREGEDFWLPHGPCGGAINDIDLFFYWLKAIRSGRTESHASYSLQVLLAERNQSPRPVRGPSPIMEMGGYAYHLDPSSCADFLRELAVAEDVLHLFDDLSRVVVGPDGLIQHIETKSGRRLEADLYIDCTATGELIEQGLGESWLSWPCFPCDRAILLPLPRDPNLPPFTKVTALNAGWMWHLPLSYRVASGYVYASTFLSDDAAARELIAQASSRKAAAGEPRFLKLRLGRRQNPWCKNCVALGPAAVALDSLVGTDAYLVQKALELLTAYFPDTAFCESLIQSFNQKLAGLIDKARDFIQLHYLLSDRNETPFWHECKTQAVPETLRTIIALHDENGIVEPGSIFAECSYHHLFVAAQRLPRRLLPLADAQDFPRVLEILGQIRAQNEQWVSRLPSHRELMDTIHKPGV